jgi:cytochrome b involved in lipid metabolism
MALAATAASFTYYQTKDKKPFLPFTSFHRTPAMAQQQNWPLFRRQEVQRRARAEKIVMVTYKDGVYDLTSFAKNHPGGSDKLHMAAGGPIETWW